MSGQRHDRRSAASPAAEGLRPVASAPRAAAARLQWRVWGDTAEVRRRLDAVGADSRSELRRDVYLLGTPPTHNAKVRGRRLEVNELLSEELGFQRWTRAVLHPLPCHGEELAPVLDALAGLDAAEVDTGRFGRRRFLAAAARRGLQPVAVTKQRQRYALGAMRAECTALWIDDAGIELSCVAIEGHDLAELIALRGHLGIASGDNVAVPAALEQVLGGRLA